MAVVHLDGKLKHDGALRPFEKIEKVGPDAR